MNQKIFSNKLGTCLFLTIMFVVMSYTCSFADTIPLCVNEFMAANVSTIADLQGDYDDWIEIFNKSDNPVSLTGLYLSDDPAKLNKWKFPDITLAAKGFLIVWADEDTKDQGIHSNFKLSASGETIIIADTNQTIVDMITFTVQTDNVSFGRYPDGGETWKSFNIPSPGLKNSDTFELADAIRALQVCAGIGLSSFKGDLNGDSKIGIQEAVSIIYELSESSEISPKTHPPGWGDKTHGSEASPDYNAIFSDTEVKKIDLVIDPANWQAMLDDMKDIYGTFGSGSQPITDNNQQAAIDACIGKNAGDSCSISAMGQNITGTCNMNMQNLMCIPKNPPPDPQIAITACVGKNAGDSCSISAMGQNITGTCNINMQNLMCMPSGGNPNGGGNPPNGGGDPVDISGGRNPIWEPCTVKFENNIWYYVGIRFKGNSSLSTTWKTGTWKLPFRLEFDQFEDTYPEIDNQRFFGFKKFAFSSNFGDTSLIREKVAADIFREAGVPAPKTSFYRVYIDYGEGSKYFGLYTMVEIPDDPMLDTNFDNSKGNLYKPEGTGASFATYDQTSFDKENNKDAADWSDVKALFDALHASQENAETWRAGLEKTFNVDGFLRWLAVNTLIQNWDTYGRMGHNYYLYNDTDKKSLNWIPWDNNFALMSGGNGTMVMASPFSLSLTEATASWPLIRYTVDDTVYWKKYVSFVKETAEGAFEPEKMKAKYETLHNLITPYVVGTDGEVKCYSFLNNSTEFDTALETLKTHAQARHDEAVKFLATNR